MPTPKSPKKAPKMSQKQTKPLKLATTAAATEPKPPQGSEPAMSTKAFKRLQKQWYAKLKREGFKDIEGGYEGGRINGQSSTDVRAHERFINNSATTSHYYSRWTCYLAHHDNGQLTYLERVVIDMYSKGMGSLEIHPYVKKYINKFQLHYLIDRLRAHVELWNKTDPNGMDFNSDFEVCRPLKKQNV